MLHIVLVEPEIPQNTGNIARTCAATVTKLHLIRPLGFEITESRVRRAGLDYWPMLQLEIHDSLDDLFWLFFGKETAGLPEWFRMDHYDRCIRIPMRQEARSLNLANSVAIVTYEALRQIGFPGLSGEGEMKGAAPKASSH